MIKKLRKKIIIYTMISTFILLLVILSSINITNFVMVAQDADRMSLNIQKEDISGNPPEPFAPTPVQYFTFKFNQSTGEYSSVSFHMEESKVTVAQATSWATSLSKKNGTGWSRRVYRYRTRIDKGYKYVTVIDQKRELHPSYNILNFSVVGGILALGIVFAGVYFISKKMVKPIEDADNKQKRFIADAAIALKTPVSVISLDNAALTSEHGEELANKSIRKQVDKLMNLSNDLNTLAVFSDSTTNKTEINLSNVLKEAVNQYNFPFSDNKKELQTSIQDDIVYQGDLGMMNKMIHEVMDNCLKYADSQTIVSLFKEGDRVILEFKNDCKGIPEGSLDRVFDRFYRLDYKDHSIYDGSGVGLSIVKEIVEKHQGRVIAKGENDWFILKIEL